ncbi:uncharacterized protein BCR38DRAFT_435597 [Pseudomassariella vexata]|uniref:RING-type domain-containing protein n=1 Tax=Pseudomassariella vexata TaxID=1141098 RepID=A0A1Y2DV27_9PEZI|nr:uncharacterized protein BCR38DRAFT_435597 [Pseudomassariella vexata]ORY62986.1 hypothetical protein BCR38DRAFT_435597 [Pseudomassariella vexata]
MFNLTNLLGSANGRSSSKSNRSSKGTPDVSPTRSRSPDPSTSHSEYVTDESQLRPLPPLPPEVLGLNNSLETLVTLFPDVQVEVFREMLASFSEESRLAVVADAMLKNPAAWVKGRRKARDAQKAHGATEGGPVVPTTEAFRGNDYRRAVRRLALHEFKGLSRSSIDAVLSESNYSYLDARPTLVELSSKSWKFAISSFFNRRKPVTSGEVEPHPLVIWRSSGHGSIVPALKSTGNAELDRELFEELIVPLKKRETASREAGDRTLALTLHTEEAQACEATYECACCFTDATFEEFTTCNTEGHMVCFRCVQHSIKEAVFGQGWQRNINKDSGTLRCPAVAARECQGCVSSEHIHRALMEETKGTEILHKLDQRLAEHGLISSGLPLVRCPFCNYAEVDDLYVPTHKTKLRLRASNIPKLFFAVIFVCLLPLSLPIIVLALSCLVLCWNRMFRYYASLQFRAAVSRYQRRRMGLKFSCQNPSCLEASCMSCSKAWVDIHICHESSLVALRTQVEQAMSMAIKRVCPRCSTSFVKTAGCNKLTCPCGYKMCYVCRKDIGAHTEGYQHFCQHFRPEGDGRQCKECRKCNLWETENTEAILREAKQEAERKWRATEQRELSDAEKAYLETGVASNKDDNVVNRMLKGGKLPSMEELCDFIVESLFVVIS